MKGGSNDDTLRGGGKDIITDYTAPSKKSAGDRILLPSGQRITEITTPPRSKNLILTIGDENGKEIGIIQINNGKGKNITINDETEESSGFMAPSMEDMWFMTDEGAAIDELGCLMQEAQVASVEPTGQFMTCEVEALFMNKREPMITYTRKEKA